VPFENGLAIMNVADRRENVVVLSGQVPAYPSPDNNAYPTENTAIQLINWSPDGRTLAFSDRISYIGTISAIGGTPRMLFGQPRAFSLNKLFWIPDSTNALLVMWNSYPGDIRTLMGVLASPGVINSAVSDRVSCPALAPNGTMLAYLSGDDTQIVRTDGITLGVISGGGCPNWSPDSTLLVTSRKASDGAIVLTNPKGQVVRLLLGTRAVEQVFWFKPS
jgi:WD40 repeat protein